MSALLPPSATPMMHAVVDAVEAVLRRPPYPLNPLGLGTDAVPASYLPWLAWQYGVPVWRASWPGSVKRAVVSEALLRARRFGTAGAYRRTMLDFGGDADLEERWDGHHTIRVSVRNINAVTAPLAEFREALERTGRASVVLTVVIAARASRGDIIVAAAVTPIAIAPLVRSYEEN